MELLQSSALPLGYVAPCFGVPLGGPPTPSWAKHSVPPSRRYRCVPRRTPPLLAVFHKRILLSGWRESNPRVNLGKVAGYHYITPAHWATATVLNPFD